jgi:LuxR family maltose regulon positive regulatory protein
MQAAYHMSLLNMPHCHRSGRDYSEYALETSYDAEAIDKGLGALTGAASDIMKNCAAAGILYEKGSLNEAYKFALLANTALRNDSPPDLVFCAKMILASVYAAQGIMKDCRQIIDGTAEMIEAAKAYYLKANFEAYKCRLKLTDGDENAARGWLKNNPPAEQIPFYKLYRSVTTARALICVGEYNSAIFFLTKILELAEAYRRPIDIIEAKILLSIACWKKGKVHQKEAVEVLENALTAAQHYSYTQVFINESAELLNILQKIQSRVQRSTGTLKGKFVKVLYYTVTVESKKFKGLTGGKLPRNLKFTKQQLVVMRHLYDGYNHREIGEIMGITYYGVKEHLKRIYGKLGVSFSSEAVLKIKELGIFDE